ncbi:unnamed protein product [Caretta caretta]
MPPPPESECTMEPADRMLLLEHDFSPVTLLNPQKYKIFKKPSKSWESGRRISSDDWGKSALNSSSVLRGKAKSKEVDTC